MRDEQLKELCVHLIAMKGQAEWLLAEARAQLATTTEDTLGRRLNGEWWQGGLEHIGADLGLALEVLVEPSGGSEDEPPPLELLEVHEDCDDPTCRKHWLSEKPTK